MIYRIFSKNRFRSALLTTLCALLLPPAAQAQDTENWARNFVIARVAAKTLQSVPLSRDRIGAPEIRSLIEARIVGGDDAQQNENPFQVALLLRDFTDNANAQFCGGTLVSPRLVVTAAHCSDFIEADNVQVLTGTRRLDGTGTRRNVARIAIHPAWNSVTLDNDIAVWEMETEETNMQLAELATSDPGVGNNTLITGWGRLAEGGSSSIDLQAVTVPRVSDADCNDANSYDGAITENMLCAGLTTGGRDSCQGDSGGPLTTGTGFGTLSGVVSWGVGCARPDLFGVYTRVSSPSVRDFLDDEIGPALTEDCIGFSSDRIEVVTINGDLKIVDGSSWLLSFGSNTAEANRTLEILRHYGANQLCFISRPGPEVMYFLSQGAEPAGVFAGEDCLRHDIANLSIIDEGSRFTVTDGRSRMSAFDRQDEAEKMIQVMQTRGLDHRCFVGRPGPSFDYMRK